VHSMGAIQGSVGGGKIYRTPRRQPRNPTA
jgi:hypothetical protein